MTVPALADLYDEYGPRLYRYALLILADASAAEDALQEAFCAVARAHHRDPDVVTVAYLLTVTRNECYSQLRRRRNHAAVLAKAILEPAVPQAGAEERLMLEQALGGLPPEQREVVFLKVYEGMTFQEIANQCACSINTAASRYRYAVDALRRTLDIDRSHT